MRLSIVSAVCGALDVTERWFAETIGNCAEANEVVIVSNGNLRGEVQRIQGMLDRLRPGWTYKLIVEPDPLGSTKSFNEGLHLCGGDVVAMLHNDLLMKQKGWDKAVLDCFAADPEHMIGVAGIHGAAQLGMPDLYVAPYEMRQLARALTFSNLVDAEIHGARWETTRECVTLDGMALIARREDLLAWGGLDERYPHHCYDHDLCLTARQHGRRNLFLPLRAHHLGGYTATASRYNDHLEQTGVAGRDTQVHIESHIKFYEKWRGTGLLPARVN